MRTRVIQACLLCVTLFSAPFFFHANRKPAAEPSPGRGAGPALSAHSTKPPVPAGKEVHEEALLTQALARKPDHTPVLLSLAKLAAESGKPKDAERHLREILWHEPGNLEARLELGKALFELGDVNGAIQETGAILKSQPSHPDALYNLGAIYGNIGNNGLARDYWTRLINADPNSESGKRAQKMIAQVAKP